MIKHFFKKTPVEGVAIDQLEKTFELKGMVRAVAMPDLHAGKGHPIGASFLTKNIIYPYLVGSDIGCGMAFAQLDILAHKIKRDKITKKISNLEEPISDDFKDIEEELQIKLERFSSSLGSVGGGNHFIEIQKIEKIVLPKVLEENQINPKNLFVMAHSGSRGLGNSILSEHIQKFNSKGLEINTTDFVHYKQEHDYAVAWAKANREILLRKVAQNLGTSFSKILDIVHNAITETNEGFIHRKGTAPADEGLVVIPGSRGDFSYLVKPILNHENLNSLAHGAGRKWKRGESKQRLSNKFKSKDFMITDLNSQVICCDKDLLYEEAPQNYKKISHVIEDLVEFGLIEVVAILRPIVTYKKGEGAQKS